MPKITIPTDGWNEAIDGWATITVKERGYEPTKIEVPGIDGTGSPTTEAIEAVQAAYSKGKLSFVELPGFDRAEKGVIGRRNPDDQDGPYTIGFSWPSKEGRREIAGVQTLPDGRTVYAVTTEGTRFAVLLPLDQIEREIARDAANVAFHVKQRGVVDERNALIATRDALLSSFLSAFEPLARGKAEKALRVNMQIHGFLAPRFQHIERLIQEGWRVSPDGKKIEGPDGRFLTQSDLTKTALDYARALSASLASARSARSFQ